MGTLAKLAKRCKRRRFRQTSPQVGTAVGHDDQATSFLTGFSTWDLDAWPPFPRVPPAMRSDCRQFSDRFFAGIETPVWRVLDCRQSTAGEILNVFALLHYYAPRLSAGGSPQVPPPCGKDVETRSESARVFCGHPVYLYPQISVARSTRARGLLLPFLGGVS